MALTTAQLDERRAYLGGTDAPALAGVNPPGWSQPIDVYLEKVGLAPARQQSKLMALGTLMEELVADLTTEATGMRWRRQERPARSRTYPFAGGHLDRVAGGYLWDTAKRTGEPGLERALLECKWAQRKDGWGEQGTGTVPLHYAVQVQHYLAVTGRPVAVLAVLLGYADFRWYRLERDEQLIARLMELEERFWREHVLAGVPPEPDGSEGYGRHLRALYAQDQGTEVVATPEQQLYARQLHELRADQREMNKLVAAAEQRLQASMGTNARMVGPDFTITWRRNKPSLKVRWEEVATKLLGWVVEENGGDWPTTKKGQAEQVREWAQEHELASTEEGARPFRVEFADEEEG